MADFSSIRFQPSRPLLRELSADRLNSILTEIKRNKPKGERGITVRQSGDGTYIGLAAALQTKNAIATTHPFKVLTRQLEENGPWHWGVIANSKALLNIAPTQGATYPDGLLAEDQLPEDPGWLEISTTETDYIYLEWDEANVTAKIDSIGNGGNFDPAVGALEDGGWLQTNTTPDVPVFQFARKIIASCEIQDNEPILTQGIVQHQLLQDICYNGNPASWWFDYTGGNVA